MRRAKSELRRTTGSEPKKLMDVAEYRSFPVGQEQEMRDNSWRSIIQIELEQYLIYMPTNGLNLTKKVAPAKILGDIRNAFGAQALWLGKFAHSCETLILFLLVHFEHSAVFCAFVPCGSKPG